MYHRQTTNFLAWVPKTIMYFAAVLKHVTNAAKQHLRENPQNSHLADRMPPTFQFPITLGTNLLIHLKSGVSSSREKHTRFCT